MKIPAVSVQFMPEGILILVVERKQVWHKMLTWKEVARIGKKGKKGDPSGFLKGMTDKIGELIDQSKQTEARLEKNGEEWARYRKEQEARVQELKAKYGVQGAIPPVPTPLAPGSTVVNG